MIHMTSSDSAPAGAEAASAEPGMPSFVVIGAQKSASTFLQDQLSLHPDIEIPHGEVRCFEDPFYAEGAVDELPHVFERPVGTAVRGIKRPGYLGRPEIPARLHRHLPEAKLFAVLREPVARAVSSYYHFVRLGFVPLKPIDEAFEILLGGGWAARYPRSTAVRSFGLYGEQLRRYLQHYRDDQLMVFEQSALIKHSREALHQAFEFIGVDPDFTPPPREVKVSNKGIYSDLRLRVVRTKIWTQYRFSPRMDRRFPRRPTPWGRLYNVAVVGIDRVVLSRFDDGRPPALSPRLRARLAAYYDDDSAVLRTIIADRPVEAPWLS